MASQVTLADVAAAAQVSPATASRVLNGSPGRQVGRELAERVMAAAADLGYFVNAHAQAMARGSSTTVGLVVHDIADPYAATIAAGVIDAAAERGLIVTIASTLSDPAVELRHIQALVQQRARAVILAGSRFGGDAEVAATSRALAALVAGGGHAAVIGQNVLDVATVEVQNRDAAARLAETLYTIGYRRFAVLAGPETLATSEERLAGFREGLATSGTELADENIIGTQFTRDGGYVAMRELIDRGFDAECIVAVNDVMAVGAMAALREQGFEVGTDVAVAGFDDIITLRDIVPPLTTVRIPLETMGRWAIDLALSEIADGATPIRRVRGEVVVRASTPGVQV